jgi:hypothetical protein
MWAAEEHRVNRGSTVASRKAAAVIGVSAAYISIVKL